MTGNPSQGRARAIDVHAHVLVPEVYAVAAEHNVFSELPTDPGVTDEMHGKIKERAVMVLSRMSDVSDRIAKMDAVVYIHPGGNRDRRFKRFSLWNSVGQAFEEAMAISSLMYDGVLEQFPKLKICISHGGGYMPFYMGRIDRNYVEKANTRVNMS